MHKLRNIITSFIRNRNYNNISAPENYYLGSAKWLIATEKKFGGYVNGVKRVKVSDHDPRSPEDLARGGMVGGDRMFHHGYASAYSKHLAAFTSTPNENFTIMEVGILRGTGLALWSDLFPKSELYALDIDPSYFLANLPALKSKGAFKIKAPQIHIFDQFVDGEKEVKEIVGDRTLDLIIDDGFHSVETIVNTAEAVKPYLSNKFVYFVEDNSNVKTKLQHLFDDCFVESYGQLTVVFR